MNDFLANLPLWVWTLAVPVVVVVAGLVARWTKPKADDWIVALVVRGLEALAAHFIKKHKDPDDHDENPITAIIEAVGASPGSTQLKGPGMAPEGDP